MNPSSDQPKPVQTLKGAFVIDGTVQLEPADNNKPDVKLRAYAFAPGGELLGSADVDEKGAFKISLSRKEIGATQLVIGPPDTPQAIRSSSAYTRSISPAEWKATSADQYTFNPALSIPAAIWPRWRKTWVCVGGRVRKEMTVDGITQLCPVPFVKVEVFDVDREFCWPWPWLLKEIELKPDLRVIQLADIPPQEVVPVPPIPDPGPLFTRTGLGAGPVSGAAKVALNPQPLPPAQAMTTSFNAMSASTGFSNVLSSAQELRQGATLTSKQPFWEIFPRCYYSTQLQCTTTTDCNGYFECCFWWPAFHFRYGRFRFDPRPDIIIKVTQIINGVPTVIYMDPFSNIRWNVTSTYIDLVLDNPEVICGTGCSSTPEGTTIFFTRVGNDYVYDIEQAGGTYDGGGYSNVAYGASLYLTAAIGNGLSQGPDPFYYRISVSKGGAPFVALTAPLSDTRVDKVTLTSQSYPLGPNVINGVPALYEIRNSLNYYWYYPDLVGIWDTTASEPDHDRYVVRLEVFDKNGVKQTSATVDYRDGTAGPPPTVLPPMVDRIDQVLAIDNKPAVLSLDVPAAGNACGVVPYSSAPFSINTSVTQPNGRLFSWALYYEKGLIGVQNYMTGESSASGLTPLPRNASTSSAPFTNGLTTTCAFSLILDAWAHIRNGYGFIYFSQLIKAVAVEKCS